MSDTYTASDSKLSVLVETDFERNSLLALMAKEPRDSLYRSVYEALYSPESARRAGKQNRPRPELS